MLQWKHLCCTKSKLLSYFFYFIIIPQFFKFQNNQTFQRVLHIKSFRVRWIKNLLLYENEEGRDLFRISRLSSSWGHKANSEEVIFMPSFIACFDPGSYRIFSFTSVLLILEGPARNSWRDTFFTLLKERYQVILFMKLKIKEQKVHLKLL